MDPSSLRPFNEKVPEEYYDETYIESNKQNIGLQRSSLKVSNAPQGEPVMIDQNELDDYLNSMKQN